MPPDEEEEVHEWLSKAAEDLEAARRLLSPEPLPTPAAFHCQQAAEKALKAYLVAQGERFRKVHNLVYLVELCQEHGAELGRFRDDVRRLDPFAVLERYPGASEAPPPEVVEDLLDLAERVVEAVEEALAT